MKSSGKIAHKVQFYTTMLPKYASNQDGTWDQGENRIADAGPWNVLNMIEEALW